MINKSALKLAQKTEINALERIAQFLSAIPKVERVVFLVHVHGEILLVHPIWIY